MLNTVHKKVALILALFSIFYIGLASHLPKHPLVPVDANVVPMGLGIILLGLSVALYFLKDEKPHDKIPKKEWGVVLTVVIFIILYISLLNLLGFLLVTLLFLFFCTWFLGYKNFISNAIVSVCVSCGIYFLFTHFLQISLPNGILPF